MKILILMRRLNSLLSIGVRGLMIVGMEILRIYYRIHITLKLLVVYPLRKTMMELGCHQAFALRWFLVILYQI